jgi:hypothetical protein
VDVAQRYNARTDITILSRRVDEERQRAARAMRLATRYGQRAPTADLRPFYSRMAELHRGLAARHLIAAELHQQHLRRIEKWLSEPRMLRPTFLGTVAASLGTPAAAATLRGVECVPAVVAASDETARAAQDLERVMGEGPAAEVMADGTSVRLAGTALLERWPRYGPAVAELGVQAVIAAPLRLPTMLLGALCVYDTTPAIKADVAEAAGVIAGALTQSVLTSVRADGSPRSFEETDFQPIVHQAAGMISVYHDVGIDDAEALLRAHAFAEGRPVTDVARDVVRRRTRLG